MSDKRTEERNETFDSAMREKMAGYEPTVPHALWNRISAELNETESEVTPSIPHYSEASASPKWKIAIAAAMILTLGVGSLLYTLNSSNGINSTSAPVAHSAAPASSPAVIIPVETKTVAQTVTNVSKHIAITPKQDSKTANEPIANTTADNNSPENVQSNEDKQLASAPVTTENNPVDVYNIPTSALKTLSTPVSLNDEITVIKSAPTAKKKHHRHSEEESTKVIVIGKKYDSQPEIRYPVPVRF